MRELIENQKERAKPVFSSREEYNEELAKFQKAIKDELNFMEKHANKTSACNS